MSEPTVIVVHTGVANTASVAAALDRCGCRHRLSTDPALVRDAPALVLPGVGSFGAGMERLTEAGLVEPIVQRIARRRPLLAICLGMHLLCQGSDESPGVPGLGVIPARVAAFPAGVRVPQFGWNRVDPGPGCRLLAPGHAYFANSYRLAHVPEGWNAAIADHAGPFIAALERGPILACQFHPELSGPWGLALLRAWLDRCAGNTNGAE